MSSCSNGASCHRRLDIHHMGQYLVFDLDQIERLLGDRR
jgi:hypothetical protein